MTIKVPSFTSPTLPNEDLVLEAEVPGLKSERIVIVERGDSQLGELEAIGAFRADGLVTSPTAGIDAYAPGAGEVIDALRAFFGKGRELGFVGPRTLAAKLTPAKSKAKPAPETDADPEH